MKEDLNNLKIDSILKTYGVYILHMNQITCKIGSVSKDLVEEYKNSYSKIISKKVECLGE